LQQSQETRFWALVQDLSYLKLPCYQGCSVFYNFDETLHIGCIQQGNPKI
jgi:hypothetical protein